MTAAFYQAERLALASPSVCATQRSKRRAAAGVDSRVRRLCLDGAHDRRPRQAIALGVVDVGSLYGPLALGIHGHKLEESLERGVVNTHDEEEVNIFSVAYGGGHCYPTLRYSSRRGCPSNPLPFKALLPTWET